MIAWIGSSLHRLRDERLSAIGLALLVFVTALAAAAAPRLEARVADDTLLATIERAQPASRNIQWLREDIFISGPDDPFGAVTAISDQVHALLPDSVAALVTERSWTIESGRFRLPEVIGDPATMRLRFQPDATPRLTLRSGRWPTGATTTGPDRIANDPLAPMVTFFEVAVSTPTTHVIGVDIGDTLMLVTDGSDPLVGRGRPLDVGVKIVGTYDVNDTTDPWWLGGIELAQPLIRSPGGDARITDTVGLLAPEAYLPFLKVTQPLALPLRYTFREFVDAARLSASAVAPILGRLQAARGCLPIRQRHVQSAVRPSNRAFERSFRRFRASGRRPQPCSPLASWVPPWWRPRRSGSSPSSQRSGGVRPWRSLVAVVPRSGRSSWLSPLKAS